MSELWPQTDEFTAALRSALTEEQLLQDLRRIRVLRMDAPEPPIEAVGRRLEGRARRRRRKTPPNLWQRVQDEFYTLVCTDDTKYAQLRREILSHARRSKGPIIAGIAGTIATTLHVTLAVISPMVVSLLLMLLRLGKEAYCSSVSK